jgi:hypothetical protein
MNTNAHLIQFNSSRSCFEVIGHFQSITEACKRRADCVNHFTYQGQELQVVSDYELGVLEAQA